MTYIASHSELFSSYGGINFEISLFSFSLKVEGHSGYIQEEFENGCERRNKAFSVLIAKEIKITADNQFETKFPFDSYVFVLQVNLDI